MTEINAADPGAARAAADVLARGGIALIPTDTVYGLAARADIPAAVARLAEIKRRDPAKPIALLASGIDAVEARAGAPLSGKVHALATRFWPGALTMVVPCADGATEGFRVPDNPFARELLSLCGGLLRVTSANVSGSTPATDFEGSRDDACAAADIAVDGGRCPGGVASTVVRLDGDSDPAILRAGAITPAMIAEALEEG